MAENITLPAKEVKEFSVNEAKDKSWPTSAILFLAQIKKAANEVEDDPTYSKLMAEEVFYLDKAADIIAKADSDDADLPAKEREAYDTIALKFGRGMQGVYNLAAALREIADNQKAQNAMNTVLNKTVDSKFGGSIAKKLNNLSPFGYKG